MITLDKLVAEERAENLQAEIEDQRDRIMALESELVLLKNGATTTRNTSTLVDSSNNFLVSLSDSAEFQVFWKAYKNMVKNSVY